MEKRIDIEFNSFMDKYFLHAKEISQETGRQFRKELDTLDISSETFLDFFIFYMEQIFLGTNIAPFVPERKINSGKGVYEWALCIYTVALKDFFDEIFGSCRGYELSGIRKQDFVAFLCGINHNPSREAYQICGNYHNMAESEEPILIRGETGTGKELHAKLFHHLSLRRDKTFLALNCSGIPESLLESQLFGHEKGAFTGAIGESKGFLSEAGEGTLFLDEIGDMSPNLQAKILRVLETGDYFRVGQHKKPLSFKGRIMAATNKDLETEIIKPEPRFRPDLYYRIGVFTVKLPSFRDLPMRVREDKLDYILGQLQYRYNIIDKMFKEEALRETSSCGGSWFSNYQFGALLSEDAKALLLAYDYPGNYRELTNILKSSLLNSGGTITVKHLPESVRNWNYRPKEGHGSPGMKYDPLQVDGVKVRDIISYADKVKRMVVEKKIENIYRDGKDLKNILRSEGIDVEKDYINIHSQITRILDKSLKTIRKAAKKD